MTRLLIVDRDGTLVVERPYLSHPDMVELLPTTAAGLRRFRALGFHIAVMTNQSGIGRGYFDIATLEAIHERLRSLLAAQGVGVDAVYFCPHTSDDGCRCRKPNDGMLRQAERDFGCDLRQAFVIGDKDVDIEAGRRVGATTLLVRTGHGETFAADPSLRPDYVVDDLFAAARVVERASAASQPQLRMGA